MKLTKSADYVTSEKLLRLRHGKWARLALCILVSCCCLYITVRGRNYEDAVQQLKRSSPTPILGAVFFLFLSYWIRAYRWSYLLLPVKQISTRPLFRSTVIGFMGNYLLPFRGGEVMRAVSIGQNQNISKAAALGSIVLERVFDGVVISLTPFLVLAAVDLPPWVVRVNLAFLAIYVAGLAALAFAIQRGRVEVWLERSARLLPELLAARLKPLAEEFVQGMKGINHAGRCCRFLCFLSSAGFSTACISFSCSRLSVSNSLLGRRSLSKW